MAGVEAAYLFGSWAARYQGVEGQRPVGDIDLLVLGEPDRDELTLASTESPIGSTEIQVTIREAGRSGNGEGTFHETIVSRPMVQIPREPVGSTG